ncbi:MAG: dynamin family protein [Magnetococcales bacterium]|nr:dynamin family protein [Magnetococcales bacterium]MBF0155037.1 dynamin family protein [Magnetococcales bacterium]
MSTSNTSQIDRRLNSLEKHLKEENPILLKVVQSFRELDWVAYRMGILSREESFATRVPWWPLISVLGTFSAGKSTFINHFLELPLQRTGNQAVDDKFTVICFSNEDKIHTLPGLALDADPRFPFYQISHEIEQVVSGEGRRIDAYLQLKTCPTEKLRGRIMIDSPGFDADAQRTSTLRITDHIINLSDLVMVFFDARHPEPGAMRDTLDHLVAKTINRHDSNKFLFILNQVDCTVREDNLEEVVAAWQRALAQSGLTAGRFYQIYNPESAHPIADATLKARYEAKRDEDMDEIVQRINRVEIERAYRIIGVLDHTAKVIEMEVVPRMRDMLRNWRKNVLITDAILLAILGVLGVYSFAAQGASASMGTWLGSLLLLDWSSGAWGMQQVGVVALALAILGVLGSVHMFVRKYAARLTLTNTLRDIQKPDIRDFLTRAFALNTRPLRSLLTLTPTGWGGRTEKMIHNVLKDADSYVQNLNDQFTNPSGRAGGQNPQAHTEAS